MPALTRCAFIGWSSARLCRRVGAVQSMNQSSFAYNSAEKNNPGLRNSLSLAIAAVFFAGISLLGAEPNSTPPRERILIDDDWRFIKGDPTNCTASLLYDVRRVETVRRFAAEADGNSALNQPTATNESTNAAAVIKHWILPTGN